MTFTLLFPLWTENNYKFVCANVTNETNSNAHEQGLIRTATRVWNRYCYNSQVWFSVPLNRNHVVCTQISWSSTLRSTVFFFFFFSALSFDLAVAIVSFLCRVHKSISFLTAVLLSFDGESNLCRQRTDSRNYGFFLFFFFFTSEHFIQLYPDKSW